MVTRYDDKGKYFTNIVTKETLYAFIQTSDCQIQGWVYIRPDQRLKDEMNEQEQFFAVTDAQVFDHAGNMKYKTKFILVNRDQVIWIIPKDELT
ncbi:MAG: hypothetical protein JW908_08790 [Anaerolineales bacterium]|nr:hypothetical protein [Anaerolineales bacterium]